MQSRLCAALEVILQWGPERSVPEIERLRAIQQGMYFHWRDTGE